MQLIWSGFILITLIFTPETYAPAILQRRAKKLRQSTGDQSYKAQVELNDVNLLADVFASFYIPFKIMAQEPMALLLDIWTAFELGIFFAFYSAFPIVYDRHGL